MKRSLLLGVFFMAVTAEFAVLSLLVSQRRTEDVCSSA